LKGCGAWAIERGPDAGRLIRFAPSTGSGGSSGDSSSLEEGIAVVSFAVPSYRFCGYALVFEQMFMNIPAFHPLLPPIV
jgi:hypothetical protein